MIGRKLSRGKKGLSAILHSERALCFSEDSVNSTSFLWQDGPI